MLLAVVHSHKETEALHSEINQIPQFYFAKTIKFPLQFCDGPSNEKPYPDPMLWVLENSPAFCLSWASASFIVPFCLLMDLLRSFINLRTIFKSKDDKPYIGYTNYIISIFKLSTYHKNMGQARS